MNSIYGFISCRNDELSFRIKVLLFIYIYIYYSFPLIYILEKEFCFWLPVELNPYVR